MNPLETLRLANTHVTAILILCRTLIHLAYLSLAVSATIHGHEWRAIGLVIASLIVPLIVARIPKPKMQKITPTKEAVQ